MKKLLFPVGILVGVLFLGYREYRVAYRPFPQIVVEKNLILFQVMPEIVFGMGRIDSSRAKALFRGMTPFFSSENISSVWDIPIGEQRRGVGFSVQRISQNLVRSVCVGQVMWWIGDNFSSEEQVQAVRSGIGFTSDWWGMTKNRLPEFLPLPSQGILYAGDRAPSSKTIIFAQEKELPLISASETNGFLLSFVNGEWELDVRD